MPEAGFPVLDDHGRLIGVVTPQPDTGDWIAWAPGRRIGVFAKSSDAKRAIYEAHHVRKARR
jgi:CBS-domain-containing membrane protein